MKNLLDFNAKVGSEDNFRIKNGNETLHGINMIRIKVANFAHLKSHCQKHNQIDNILKERQWHSSVLKSDHSWQQTVIMTTIWQWQI
jgi:hypothetical protein